MCEADPVPCVTRGDEPVDARSGRPSALLGKWDVPDCWLLPLSRCRDLGREVAIGAQRAAQLRRQAFHVARFGHHARHGPSDFMDSSPGRVTEVELFFFPEAGQTRRDPESRIRTGQAKRWCALGAPHLVLPDRDLAL